MKKIMMAIFSSAVVIWNELRRRDGKGCDSHNSERGKM
jgi:hypothetical protein